MIEGVIDGVLDGVMDGVMEGVIDGDGVAAPNIPYARIFITPLEPIIGDISKHPSQFLMQTQYMLVL